MTSVDGLERRRAFCAQLKAERERHGTTLSAIADATKVKASLLEALERGDVSHWPKGIYRRAFFRDYVTAFGLKPEPYAAEFHALFPDADDALVQRPSIAAPPAPPVALPPESSPQPQAAPGLASSLRLTLAHEEFSRWTAPLRSWPRTAAGHPSLLWLAAAVDLALVVGAAFAVSAVSSVGVEGAAAVIGAVYYSLGTAMLGRTPACWWALRTASPTTDAAARAGAHGDARRRVPAVPQPDLRQLVGQTLRARSAVRDYVVRLSDSRSLMAGARRRDLAQLRRRRIDTANSPADQGF